MRHENLDRLHQVVDLVNEVVGANTVVDADGAHVREGPFLGEEKLASARRIIDDILRAEALADPTTLLTPEETALIAGKPRRFIEAIKSVRARTGLTLVQAKELVEQAGDKLGFREPGPWGGRAWTA